MANRPTPTALKKLAGNPGKRPMNEHEIVPTIGAPVCPEWLIGDAREEWNRIVPELDRLGVLTRVDNSVLVGHCATYAEIVSTVKAREPLKAALLGQMRAYACELGLTPAARAKLSVPPPKDEDETAHFFQ
jgi:phage terminase small subunit